MHNAYQKAITKMFRCFEVRSILENNKIYKYYMKTYNLLIQTECLCTKYFFYYTILCFLIWGYFFNVVVIVKFKSLL